MSGQAARRWALVGAGTAILCLVPALVAALPVPASALSAAQLRARILKSADVPYQGYAESDVNLDLPALPDLGNVIALLDGTTDQYVWYRSAGQWRADVLTTAGEDDTYVTSRGTFTWNYTTDLMTQIQGTQPVRLPRAADLLPPALATRLLGFAGHADRIMRVPSQRVAGIDAAGLRLVPASRFLDVSLRTPSVADVTPDPAPDVGFTVTGLADVSGVLNGFGPPLPGDLAGFGQVASPAGLPDVAVYGDGFARFVVLPLPERTGAEAMTTASAAGASIQIRGGTAVLVTTPLLTVLLASPPGGPVYLLTGAVTPRLLDTAATQLLAGG